MIYKKQEINWIIILVFSIGFLQCSPKKSVLSNSKYENASIQLSNNNSSYQKIDTSIINDKKMLEMLNPYKIKMQAIMNETVGKTKTPLTKAQPESTLGNLIADAQLWAIKKEISDVIISVSNQGGIRIPFVSSGEISIGKVYEIMPFENKLTVLEMPADSIQRLCNHIAEKGGWPVAGISFVIKNKKAENIKINNKPINPLLIYKIVTTDYLANGGDNCDFFKSLKRKNFNILLRDAIIEYLKQNSMKEPIHIKIENRIVYDTE